MTAEHARLEEAREQKVPWKKWGPYLSERQWGTVREDYSEGGDAWDYFTHDQARSRAYRWGEDGLAGISDDQQRLCFALALWNGKDPILKERLFGLTNSESNHGEDVKEYYFYLDSTPTHSYMKYLYKYPQAAFPYADLVETSRGRSRHEFEYELLDTGVFDEDRYFDVFVEYAKAVARGHPDPDQRPQPRPGAGRAARPADALVPQPVVLARRRRPADAPAGRRRRGAERRQGASIPSWASATSTARATSRCCSPRTRRTRSASSASPTAPRTSRTASTTTSSTARQDAVNPGEEGDEGRGPLPPDGRPGRVPGDPAPAHRRRAGRPRASQRRRRRSVRQPLRRGAAGPRAGGRRVLRGRHPPSLDADAANVMRQALAGMLWSKQFYHYDVDKWLEERGSDPFKADAQGRAAQRPLAPHVQRRRHLHAGQVGVSLVRGLGPRLPRPRPDARGPGLRQAAAEADAARAVHAPQRPDPGLRVELRRRQPAGACLVHHLHLPPGEGADRARATRSGSRAASRSCC